MPATMGPAGGATGDSASDTSAHLLLVLMAALWAGNFSITKEALETIPPLAFNALRFPFGCAVVLAALFRRGPFPKPERADLPRIILFGLLGNAVYQCLFIFGLSLSRAGTASILLAGTPIITALLSALAGHERVATRTWLGVAATAVGVTIVVVAGESPGDRQATALPGLGEILMVCAGAAWASYTVGTRDLVRRYGSMPVTAWTLIAGTCAILVIGLPDLLATDLAGIDLRGWFAIFYAGGLSVGTAYLIWHFGVHRIGSTRTASFANLVPVLALVFAWFWLGEVPLTGQLAGIAIIIAGVTVAQRRAPHRPTIGS